ncbi:prolyl aminopeptidase [Allokutzneria oryzae]|uniref:Proline iminopeptidase n=1 Tax=Allokutzneria oryzae TaxID=1378989 RepID=A0ABV6AAN8_9PSEU
MSAVTVAAPRQKESRVTTRFPMIEPYDHGMLDVGDGHQIYWETCGNPDGKPAVVVHGGPGMGCRPGLRTYFDPDAYRVVLFDQRNCGRSTPRASEPVVDLSTNTTDHLLSDMERLREHLGIDKWLLFGGSWGSVLSVTYALRHPSRVTEMIVTGVATGRHSEIEWLIDGFGPLAPEAFERFRAGVPDPGDDISAAYHRLLMDPDPAVHLKAAEDWCAWEDAVVTVPPGRDAEPGPWDTPEFKLTFARLVTHYFSNRCWLDDDELERGKDVLKGVPGVIVHGRLDLSALAGNPWVLHSAWQGSELVIVEHGAHASGTAEAIVAATNRFARS